VSATEPHRMTARSRRIAARRRNGRRASGRPSPTKSGRLTPAKAGRPDVINLGFPGPAKAGHSAPAAAGRFDPVDTGYLDLMEPLNGDRRVGKRRQAGRPPRVTSLTGLFSRVPRAIGGVTLVLGAAGAVALHLVLFGRAKRHIGF